MNAAADDWRRKGQEHVLPPGTELIRRAYGASRPDCDHDHCTMCSAKFGDAPIPDALTEGYTTTADYPRGEGYEWVCPGCFEDFADEFIWKVVN